MKSIDYGVCRLTTVPVFDKSDYSSLQHNQLLFGETYWVTGEKNGWLSILTTFDEVGGWIMANQHHSITQEYFDQINNSDYKITTDISASLLYNKNPLTIVMGSIVPISSAELFNIEEQLAFNGESKSVSQKREAEFVKSIISKFINAPFTPGGKIPFGSDASGFIQMAFKIAGYKLPRSADDWTTIGNKIDNIDSASLADIILLKTDNKISPAFYLGSYKALYMNGFVQPVKMEAKGIAGANRKTGGELFGIRRVIGH